MSRKKKKSRPTVEIATEVTGQVLDVATRAGGVARRLLRRTRLLSRRAPRRQPMAPGPDPITPDGGRIVSAMPDAPMAAVSPDGAAARELEELRRRAERAEHAAAWLRVRLRAERAGAKAPPRLDVPALAADLTRDLARLYAAHPDIVRQIVQRTLAAHGLPISSFDTPRGAPMADLTVWTQAQQDLLAQQVLARAPEVSDPAYVYRALAALTRRGRQTLPALTSAAGLDSAMARRRLRLAVEALAALGALAKRDGAYVLNPSYRPLPLKGPASPRPGEPPKRMHHRQS